MELTGFIPLVRRWWPVLLASTLVAGATAYVLASRLAPTYEAEVSLLTGPINTDFTTLRASGELARTYSELATSGPLLRPSANAVGVRDDVEKLRESVSATSNEVTRIVTIRVRNGDAAVAARFANTLARRLTELSTRTPRQDIEAVDELMRDRAIARLPERVQDGIRAAVEEIFGQPIAGRLQVVDQASPPTDPVAPPVSLITMLAGLAGLLGAGVLILAKEYSRDAIEDEDELAEVAHVPVLAAVDGLPRGVGGGAQALVVEAVPESRTADAYRVLATKIGLFEDESTLRSLLVIGSGDGDGSGRLAAELAAVLAERDARVTLVDANTVEGEITSLLGLGAQAGYTDLVGRNGELAGPELDGLRIRRTDELDVLPRGNAGGPGVLEAERARQLLDRLLDDADVVVVNAPPVERSPSTLVWARVADGTVLVVREGKSRREDVTDTVESLSMVDAKLIGTVLRENRRAWRRRR